MLSTRRTTASLAAISLAAIAACGSSDPADSDEATTTDAPVTSSAPATTDVPPPTDAPATTGVPATTEAPSTTDTPAPTDVPATTDAPPTTDAPATTEAPSTTDTPATTDATVAAWADGCFEEPLAPPFLNSGQPVGEPVIGETDTGATTVTWGEGTGDEITQILTRAPTESFAIAEGFDEVLSAGDLESAVVPVGPPIGPIGIYFRDIDNTCVRHYLTPGSLGDEGVPGSMDEQAADAYATEWLDALAS